MKEGLRLVSVEKRVAVKADPMRPVLDLLEFVRKDVEREPELEEAVIILRSRKKEVFSISTKLLDAGTKLLMLERTKQKTLKLEFKDRDEG